MSWTDQPKKGQLIEVVDKTFWIKLSNVPYTMRLPEEYAAAVLATAKEVGDYVERLRVTWKRRQVWKCQACRARPAKIHGLMCDDEQCIAGAQWAYDNGRIKLPA